MGQGRTERINSNLQKKDKRQCVLKIKRIFEDQTQQKKYEKHGGKYTFLWYCCFDNVLLGWDWEKGSTDYNLGMGQNKIRNEKAKKCVYVDTANMYEIKYE